MSLACHTSCVSRPSGSDRVLTSDGLFFVFCQSREGFQSLDGSKRKYIVFYNRTKKREDTTTAMRKYLLVVENVKVLLFLSLLTLGHGRQIVVG
jgi:hypothetical protein